MQGVASGRLPGTARVECGRLRLCEPAAVSPGSLQADIALGRAQSHDPTRPVGLPPNAQRRALAPEAVDRLRRLLPNGPLPTPAHMPFGNDGATFTLTIGRGVNAAEYAWWSYPPVEWESLRAIVGVLLISAGVSTYVDQYPGLLS